MNANAHWISERSAMYMQIANQNSHIRSCGLKTGMSHLKVEMLYMKIDLLCLEMCFAYLEMFKAHLKMMIS